MDKKVPSLDALHDIVPADAATWWPLAPGWWILGAGLLIAAVIFAWRCWVKARRNFYRKEALAELERASSVADVAVILRRCVRVWKSAEEVNGLSEKEWFALLSASGEPVPEDIRETWNQSIYGSGEASLEVWKNFASQWIQHHQAEGTYV